MLATLLTRSRWFFWTAVYRSLGRAFFAHVGRGCWFEGWVDVPAVGGEIRIGARVRICRGVELSAPRGGRIEIGEGSFVGRGVVISAHRSVEVGPRCLIAEYVCIHDNDHVLDRGDSAPAFLASPVKIGEGCWLGAHSVLVRGSSTGRDCVVGAGAVLTSSLESSSVAVGVPARVVGAR